MSKSCITASTKAATPTTALSELVEQLGAFEPSALVFFHSIAFDGRAFSAELQRRFPATPAIGCSTCGHFTQAGSANASLVLIALGPRVVKRASAARASFDKGVESGIRCAVSELSRAFGGDIRELDPDRHVGIVLIEGTKMREEAVNAALGNAAPFLSFVGGSAGDDLAFSQAWVHAGGQSSGDGAALLLLEVERGFTVLKTCNYLPGDRTFKITAADPSMRAILELDGRPALETYAEAIGADPVSLEFAQFLKHPIGLMLDGVPWLRSPYRTLPDRQGIMFACEVLEGMEVHVMRGHDIVEQTRVDLAKACESLGGTPAGGVLFNCAYRKLEVEIDGLGAPYHEVLSGFPLAGFHTHGESWLGHINQTLVGLLLR